MKKVLILCNSCIGLYKFRKELLERLLEEKVEIYISTPFDNLEIIQELKKMDCQISEINIDRRGMNPIKDLKLLFNYFELMRKIKPNVVLTYTIKPNLYGGIVSRLVKIPYIVNITGLGTALEKDGNLQKILLFFYKIAIKNAQIVFFQNLENKEFMLKNRIIQGRYDILPGSGVNLNQYQALEYPKTKTIDFIFVARIMKEKGIEQYLDAAKIIRKKYPKTRFHICGFCEDNYKDILEELSEQKIIIYHGLVNNMIDIYKISSCTIHPTYYPEGLSNVLLESAASGRPIITTNRAGCREVIEDGKNGFLIKQQDTIDLIQKIEKFLNLNWQEQKEMGLKGRKKVEKEFNRNIVVEKYMKELE